MPSEIKRLLETIENERLATRRGLTGLASVARHAFITARQTTIDQAHARLIELCGEKATDFVEDTIQNADLLYDCQQLKEQLREQTPKNGGR